MSWLTIEELFPGMKLAQDVFNKRGVLIIGQGVELTEKHINILKTWGILEVNIEGMESKSEDSESALEKELGEDIIADIDNSLEKKFAQAGETEIIKEIKRIVRRIKITKMAKNLSGER